MSQNPSLYKENTVNRNPIFCRLHRSAVPLVVLLLLVVSLSARATLADTVASLQAGAYAPSPTIIGPGDSYSVQFWSRLQPNEQGVENLTATGQSWDITSVAFSPDDVNWTTIWSGNATTATIAGQYESSFSLSGSTGSATLAGTTYADPTPDGFYDVTVATTANYQATVNGQPKNGQASANAATTEPVAQITGVTVGTPATETNMTQNYPNTGDINYGAVEAANANAMATAATSPGNTAIENQIKWPNGSAVQGGSNAERNYSLAASQKYTIDPTLAGHAWNGHNVYLWVIWATVTIDDTGNNPEGAPSFLGAMDDYGLTPQRVFCSSLIGW